MSSRYANVLTVYLTSKEFWDWRTTLEPAQIDLAETPNSTVFRVAASTVFLLPAIFSKNLIFRFLGAGGIWEIVPTGGRQIFFGRMATSQGGRVKATLPTDSLEIFSLESGDWKVSGSLGNIGIL